MFIEDRRIHFYESLTLTITILSPLTSHHSPLEILRHFCNAGIHLIDELLDGHDALLTTALRTNGHSTVSLLLLTDNHHIGDTLQLVVADLTTQLLVAQVDRGTNATHIKLLGHLLSVVIILL